jgi:hypothetical protein
MTLSERRCPDCTDGVQTMVVAAVLVPMVIAAAPPLTTASHGYKERAQGRRFPPFRHFRLHAQHHSASALPPLALASCRRRVAKLSARATVDRSPNHEPSRPLLGAARATRCCLLLHRGQPPVSSSTSHPPSPDHLCTSITEFWSPSMTPPS